MGDVCGDGDQQSQFWSDTLIKSAIVSCLCIGSVSLYSKKIMNTFRQQHLGMGM